MYATVADAFVRSDSKLPKSFSQYVYISIVNNTAENVRTFYLLNNLILIKQQRWQCKSWTTGH